MPKILSFKGWLNESLPVSIAKEYAGMQRREEVESKLNELFTRLSELPGAQKSKRGDRVYFEFNYDAAKKQRLANYKSPIQIEVEKELEKAGFTIIDYIKGIVKDSYNREVKIGTALKKIKRPDLVDKVNGDEIRVSRRNNEDVMYIVFSKHPYDIASMTGGRGWKSCVDVVDKKTGFNWEHVEADIKSGSFISYVIKKEDFNINNPAARVVFKKLQDKNNDKNVVFYPDRMYGTASEKFVPFAKSIVDKVQDFTPGTYILNKEVYGPKNKDVYVDDPSMRTGIDMHSQGYHDAFSGKSKPKTKDVVLEIIKDLGITNYTINEDLSIDVEGKVDLYSKNLIHIPLNFRNVTGNFICSKNQLISLDGSPKVVKGFNCSENNLKDLVGAPTTVTGNFSCYGNPLTSMDGAPQEIAGTFVCFACDLDNLKGGPKIVGGDYECSQNKLTSFEGAPKKVGGTFTCQENTPLLSKNEIDWLKTNIEASDFEL